MQYAENYGPIKIRAAIIPITNFGSKLAMPLILLGILCTFLGSFSDTLVYMGIAAFGMSFVFQIVTLPVEFNASRRAMQAIENANILPENPHRRCYDLCGCHRRGSGSAAAADHDFRRQTEKRLIQPITVRRAEGSPPYMRSPL